MKKINLTIPKPCHENWAQMTQDEKGRFCGACQKTVVDFTQMSDRDLAVYFKKPVGSVCGRLHKDQLNRELAVPRKRIPFLRYFFHIAWPAFLIMLKSCGPKDRVANKNATTSSVMDGRYGENETYDVTMGTVVTPLESDDDIIPPMMGKVVAAGEINEDNFVKGEVAAIEPGESDHIMGGIVALPVDTVDERDSVATVQSLTETDTAFVEMDTVTVSAKGLTRQAFIKLSCGAAQQQVRYTYTEADDVKPDPVATATVYPNPAKAGGILNIRFAGVGKIPVSVQLLTATGQRVLHKQLKGATYTVTIPLPFGLTPGIYFLQLLQADGAIEKVTVMVTR